jgi:SPP1 family predicted phage head-tail adaptor
MATTPKDPCALPAGDLRHTITFLQRSISTDNTGNVEAWSSYGTARAKVEPYRGTDLIRAGQDVTQTFITISTRYRADVDATMRILHDTHTYVIQGIEDLLGKHRVLRFTCLGIGAND